VGGQKALLDPPLLKVGGQRTPLTPCFRGLWVHLTKPYDVQFSHIRWNTHTQTVLSLFKWCRHTAYSRTAWLGIRSRSLPRMQCVTVVLLVVATLIITWSTTNASESSSHSSDLSVKCKCNNFSSFFRNACRIYSANIMYAVYSAYGNGPCGSVVKCWLRCYTFGFDSCSR